MEGDKGHKKGSSFFRDGICVETTQMRGRLYERAEGWGGGEGEVGDEQKDQEQVKMAF